MPSQAGLRCGAWAGILTRVAAFVRARRERMTGRSSVVPTYCYECSNVECPTGGQFHVQQSIKEDRLKACPECGEPVERVISGGYINVPTSDTDLRDKGFAKLVRRDKGVYENVTALEGESKFWDADKPGTMPDIHRRCPD